MAPFSLAALAPLSLENRTVDSRVPVHNLWKNNRRAFRRALTWVLAASAFAAAVPVSAQNQVARLLPNPGSIGTVLRGPGQLAGPVAPGTKDHPLFHSSYMGNPTEVVARTKYGNVSAQDLYLWLIMRDGTNQAFLLEAYKKAHTTSEKRAIAKALRMEIDEFVFTNYVIPKLMGNAPCDGTAAVKEEIYSLPAYQLAYIKKLIEPAICIQEADRVKYLQEHVNEIARSDRWRTRYIFQESAEQDPFEEQDKVEAQLNRLRQQIISGDVSFAEAAKENSQAPSASRGGEIPPFRSGELFFLYEDSVSRLAPGELSRVFRGPRGYYLVQLIEVLPKETPSLDNPEHARKVDEGLGRQIVASLYDWELRSLLAKTRRPTYRLRNWDLLQDQDIVGEVCGFKLTKECFRESFPAVEGNDLQFRASLAEIWLKTTIEREAMALEVRELGLDNDPLIQRARWMAGNLVRRDGYADRLRAGLAVNEDLVREFWASNPRLFTPLSKKLSLIHI